MTVTDSVTEKKWVLTQTQKDYSNEKIGEAYDRIQPDLDACDIACQYPENDGQPLRIVFKKGGVQKYEYHLPQSY